MLVALAVPQLDVPGLYYDEAFMASQAKDFVVPQARAEHPPGVRSIDIGGRPFPWMNVAYLGALKSQLTIPSLFAFGPTLPVLRLTTLAFGLLGLWFAMAFARELFGVGVAVVTGLLLAADPTFQFLTRYEWGPFTIGLLCRVLGGFLVLTGWRRASPARLAAGGFVFGLGVFSRADFVVFLAATGLALLAARPGLVREAWVSHRRRALAALGGLTVGLLPTLSVLPILFQTLGGMPDRGGLPQKLAVLGAMADGSYAHRLMQAGGRFELLASADPGGAGIFGEVFLAAFLGLGIAHLRGRGGPARPAHRFVLLATLLLLAGMLLLPGAVRVHHQMNVVPLPQLVVACALVWLWQAGRRGPRVAAAAVLAGTLLFQGAATARVASIIDETGGRGWWSDAIHAFAERADAPGNTLVSFDWGFHEPLLYLTSHARLLEPPWEVRREQRGGRGWMHEGDAQTYYLVHPPDYDRFAFGPPLMALAERSPSAEVEVIPDRSGDPALVVIRFDLPHRLIYDGRGFSVRARTP